MRATARNIDVAVRELPDANTVSLGLCTVHLLALVNMSCISSEFEIFALDGNYSSVHQFGTVVHVYYAHEFTQKFVQLGMKSFRASQERPSLRNNFLKHVYI